MTDRLKERLLQVESSGSPMGGHGVTTCWYRNPDGPEALDRITQLEAEVERLNSGLSWASNYEPELVAQIRNRAALHQGDRKL